MLGQRGLARGARKVFLLARGARKLLLLTPPHFAALHFAVAALHEARAALRLVGRALARRDDLALARRNDLALEQAPLQPPRGLALLPGEALALAVVLRLLPAAIDVRVVRGLSRTHHAVVHVELLLAGSNSFARRPTGGFEPVGVEAQLVRVACASGSALLLAPPLLLALL